MKTKYRKWINPLFIGTTVSLFLMILWAVRLTVPVISDETTTMANAAWLTGYDWSLMVASLGGLYYRYGQSLLTIPFFQIFSNPEMIYRMSMILQAVIQVSIIPVIYLICKRHLQMQSEKMAVLYGMAVCFVPSMALYVFYYRGDFLLGVLPWYVLLALLESMKAVKEEKKGQQILWTTLAILFTMLSYAAHTRGIIVIIALLLTVIILRLAEKKRTIYWPAFFIILLLLATLDYEFGSVLKNALYSIGGLNANSLESTDVKGYFTFFSYTALKDLVMICLSWLYTLLVSTQGLVGIGVVVGIWGLIHIIYDKKVMTIQEKTAILFSMLIFSGYYVAGALFFRGTYIAARSGALEKRIDRLLYDRYAICGAGMIIFVALYALCTKRNWLKWKSKLLCLIGLGGVTFVWIKKIFPVAVKYKGYIYNTIILNTFQKIEKPSQILSGHSYSKTGLVLISILGIGIMISILLISISRSKKMSYVLLAIVLVSDLVLIQVNYIKIRKASNDYVTEATHDVVQFMQQFEDEVTGEFPYILKGGLSGIKIQFYQSQLMSYKMFGKKQEEQVNTDNYFIISKHDDIDMTWYNQDYYLFDDFDYENADYDIIYVKGEQLKEKMEQLGYTMVKYEKSAVEPFY